MHTGSKFKVTRFSFQIKIEDSYNGERNFKFYPRLYVRSFFLLKLPVKTCSRLFVAFRLVHLENAINPASPRQQISMIPLLISGRRFPRSLSRGISLDAKLYEQVYRVRFYPIVSDRENGE